MNLGLSLSQVSEFLHLLFEPFLFLFNPGKRIFWLYLLSSIFIAFLATFLRGQSTKDLIKMTLSSNLWKNRSSLVDIQWFVSTHVFRVLVIVPIIGGQIALALAINKFLYLQFGEGNFFEPDPWITGSIFTVVLFLVEDFSRFLLHFSYHKVPFLWRFHAIHHSATTLNPITLYRVHFVEMALNSCRSLLVIGGISGMFIYLFEGSVEMMTIMGVGIFNIFFNLIGANLRHSHVWVSFGIFEKWLISPAQHQIHHSKAKIHVDKNFGSALSIWDRWFGSWMSSKDQTVKHFGIYKDPLEQNFLRQIKGLK